MDYGVCIGCPYFGKLPYRNLSKLGSQAIVPFGSHHNATANMWYTNKDDCIHSNPPYIHRSSNREPQGLAACGLYQPWRKLDARRSCSVACRGHRRFRVGVSRFRGLTQLLNSLGQNNLPTFSHFYITKRENTKCIHPAISCRAYSSNMLQCVSEEFMVPRSSYKHLRTHQNLVLPSGEKSGQEGVVLLRDLSIL